MVAMAPTLADRVMHNSVRHLDDPRRTDHMLAVNNTVQAIENPHGLENAFRAWRVSYASGAAGGVRGRRWVKRRASSPIPYGTGVYEPLVRDVGWRGMSAPDIERVELPGSTKHQKMIGISQVMPDDFTVVESFGRRRPRRRNALSRSISTEPWHRNAPGRHQVLHH